MQIRDRPRWRTIVGGARSYVDSLLEPLLDRIRFRCPVASVARHEREVILTTADGLQERFDQVVFACHADQALSMLDDATYEEREVLGAFPYHANEAVLHTDTALLPKRRPAWASWNYHIPHGDEHAASVTYDLSRLQNHATRTPILLTLNATDEIAQSKIIRTFNYAHPAYSKDSISAQRRHRKISGQQRTHYCGAYWGYGFHEDGVNSALAVTAHFGIELNACTVASMKEASHIAVTSR